MRALIVEPGGDRGSLSATRALSRAGWTVGVASSGGRGLAGYSRFASRRHRVPGAQEDLDRFVAAVSDAVDEGDYEVVFCGAGDAEVTALSLRRAEIPAVIPYPPHEVVLRAVDKLELSQAAERVGLEVPSIVEATSQELERVRSPVMVKARLHAPLGDDLGPSRLEAMVASDRASASRRAKEVRSLGGVPLLQELVSGSLVAFVAVADSDSRIVARVQQVAEGTWPPAAGASARARTTRVDEELASRVSALLAELGWFGLAELQFITAGGGAPKLIDLNARYYGSLALAVSAGANLPAVWASLATGREPPLPAEAAPGVRYQWLEGDLRRALVERRGGLGRDILGSLGYARGATHSIWSHADPCPAMLAAGRLASRASRRATGRAAGT